MHVTCIIIFKRLQIEALLAFGFFNFLWDTLYYRDGPSYRWSKLKGIEYNWYLHFTQGMAVKWSLINYFNFKIHLENPSLRFSLNYSRHAHFSLIYMSWFKETLTHLYKLVVVHTKPQDMEMRKTQRIGIEPGSLCYHRGYHQSSSRNLNHNLIHSSYRMYCCMFPQCDHSKAVSDVDTWSLC